MPARFQMVASLSLGSARASEPSSEVETTRGATAATARTSVPLSSDVSYSATAPRVPRASKLSATPMGWAASCVARERERPARGELLGVGEEEHDVVREPRTRGERARRLEEGRDARPVVARAAALGHAVVVRREQHRGPRTRARKTSDDVLHLRRMDHRRGLQCGVGLLYPHLEPQLGEHAQEVCAHLLVRGRPDGVGRLCDRLDVPERARGRELGGGRVDAADLGRRDARNRARSDRGHDEEAEDEPDEAMPQRAIRLRRHGGV